MSNITKKALMESLKKLMLQKPLNKITINDLTADCGISRMAFYYHFRDIYDLVEWACLEESTHCDAEHRFRPGGQGCGSGCDGVRRGQYVVGGVRRRGRLGHCDPQRHARPAYLTDFDLLIS